MCLRYRIFILKTAVEHSKIPFALSLSKGERGFGMLTKWVSVWKPFMLRQAQHERLPHASTALFRFMGTYKNSTKPLLPQGEGAYSLKSTALTLTFLREREFLEVA